MLTQVPCQIPSPFYPAKTEVTKEEGNHKRAASVINIAAPVRGLKVIVLELNMCLLLYAYGTGIMVRSHIATYRGQRIVEIH